MSNFQHVWLIWSLAFLSVFVVIYLFYPRLRTEMLRAAIGTTPFGLTEPLFVPVYWSPPSLFDLARTTGFDIESLIFSFSIGGIGSVLYNLVTGRVSYPGKMSGHHRFHWLAVATPAFVFLPLMATGWNPIYPAVIAMAAGAVAAALCRPDLLSKTLAGGALFLGLYAIFMITLRIGAPGYIEQVWNLRDLSGWLIAGIPLEEFLFGGAFGLYWASVYEHLTWASARRDPEKVELTISQTEPQTCGDKK
ncbi:lycopene cyclase domain-containing protein [Novosphingobium malaysiense]|uniref:lycopene cyclase domain-containing protein n=1 Tax=Novosphingobium malaysiense TaxID=1348853 RepID=UPI00068AC882|nr:lycopene cyclase domain-containing protein [Novosphingobium malaysiense]